MRLVERHFYGTWWLVGLFLEDKSHWDLVRSNNFWTRLFIFVEVLQRIESLNPGSGAICKATRCKIQAKSLAVCTKTE